VYAPEVRQLQKHTLKESAIEPVIVYTHYDKEDEKPVSLSDPRSGTDRQTDRQIDNRLSLINFSSYHRLPLCRVRNRRTETAGEETGIQVTCSSASLTKESLENK
jgi:hypothetical protein